VPRDRLRFPLVQIVVSDAARTLIEERGGRLFVRVNTARCCGRLQTLEAKSEVENAADYRSAVADDGFEVFVPRNLARLPEELHLEARRFPRRIEAYWDGCAWIV
jgi:hypothetical protein